MQLSPREGVHISTFLLLHPTQDQSTSPSASTSNWNPPIQFPAPRPVLKLLHTGNSTHIPHTSCTLLPTPVLYWVTFQWSYLQVLASLLFLVILTAAHQSCSYLRTLWWCVDNYSPSQVLVMEAKDNSTCCLSSGEQNGIIVLSVMMLCW